MFYFERIFFYSKDLPEYLKNIVCFLLLFHYGRTVVKESEDYSNFFEKLLNYNIIIRINITVFLLTDRLLHIKIIKTHKNSNCTIIFSIKQTKTKSRLKLYIHQDQNYFQGIIKFLLYLSCFPNSEAKNKQIWSNQFWILLVHSKFEFALHITTFLKFLYFWKSENAPEKFSRIKINVNFIFILFYLFRKFLNDSKHVYIIRKDLNINLNVSSTKVTKAFYTGWWIDV